MLNIAAVFRDHMVLQRQKNIVIWGTVDSDEDITVSMYNQVVTALIKEGHFEVTLAPMEAGGPYTMVIRQGEEVIRFHDILVGEVWLAGGQSNMELPLEKSLHGTEKVKTLQNEKIRYYSVPRMAYFDKEYYEQEGKTSWEVCKAGACGQWSAVATYFAEYIQQELKVPVGIIGCNWGGTSASCWTSVSYLQSDSDTNQYIKEYEQAMAGKTLEQYEKELVEYQEWYEVWQKKVDALYEKNPDITWEEVEAQAGVSRWPEPLGPRSPYRPGGLRETMTMRVAGYSLRGIIYYQGEEDEVHAAIYDKLLSQTIAQFRKDFREETLPFLFVQLPMHAYKEQQDDGSWARLRENQLKVFRKVKNTAMVVAIDCGEFNNIHPVEKKRIGKRLALQALHLVYEKNIKCFGPMVDHAIVEEEKVLVYLRHVKGKLIYKEDLLYDGVKESGLMGTQNTCISGNGFEVAGVDGIYHKADIRLMDSMIEISAKQVERVCKARYAYHNFGPVTVFDQSGMPLHPFEVIVQGKNL